MMKMLALVPLPNQPGDNDNYFNSGTQRLNRNNFDAKVNWNRNERHQVWFKYSVDGRAGPRRLQPWRRGR